MIAANKVIVALDTYEEIRFLKLIESLRGQGVWVKIGMEVFYSIGPKAVHLAKEQGLKVFLDLKLHDIPNTTSQGIKMLSQLPIDMLNVHAVGGEEMMRRCADAIKTHPKAPLLIAVTQLTSTTKEQMNNEQGIQGEIAESVVRYAQLAKAAGLDGVVCSPLEVKTIKTNLGANFLTITPGIRPIESGHDDQKRITTPQEAISLGTDYMVIGRPITGASNPLDALNKILQGK